MSTSASLGQSRIPRKQQGWAGVLCCLPGSVRHIQHGVKHKQRRTAAACARAYLALRLLVGADRQQHPDDLCGSEEKARGK